MNNKKQQYLENYYKNLCEELMQKISLLEKSLVKRKKDAASKKLDPVGKEDADIDNDGKPNTKADKYLNNRRKARAQAIAKKKKKEPLSEGSVIGGGNVLYGGFPRILNEVKYDIPAKARDIEGDLGAVGIDEFHKILSGGGNPVMAGQTVNGKRGVPKAIRDTGLMHLNRLKKHPQGKVEGYGRNHPIYKEARDAHGFFKKHFPEFGVEDQIKQDYNLD